MGAALAHIGAALEFEFRRQGSWMWINFILAVFPVLGAFVLHRRWERMGPSRWAVLSAVILLLPNAPYVVTDLIHLRDAVEGAPTRAAVWVGVIPMFAILIAAGVLSYAYTLHLMRKRMRWAGWSLRRRVAVEVAVSLLCAVGVALGRISRLNSWDVFRPDRLLHGISAVALHLHSVALALVVVVIAGVAVDWAASEAAHTLRDSWRQRHAPPDPHPTR